MTEGKKRKNLTLFVLAAFTLGVLLAVTAFYLTPIKPSMAVGQEDAGQSPVGTNLISDIVGKSSPAVVLIETTVQRKQQSYDPFFNDPFFREFFGNRVPFENRTEPSRGMGSGFIISKDGYILTNEHVVSGATKIEVVLAKDKRVPAELMGSDFELDLAVLKIDAGNNLPYLEFGDTDNVRVGDWAIAIGNPHGLDHTVTVGVISAKGRPVTIQNRNYKNLLQTDASINPGNSGGPLLNMNGKVIGINTAVNVSAQGIGFAIPTSTVRPVLDILKQKGKVSHPWLGVYIQPVTDEIAQYLGMEKARGILISDVVEGGPAHQAGLTRGDVIFEIDKEEINTTKDLTSNVEKKKVGQKVMVLIHRNGQLNYVPVTIGEKGNTR